MKKFIFLTIIALICTCILASCGVVYVPIGIGNDDNSTEDGNGSITDNNSLTPDYPPTETDANSLPIEIDPGVNIETQAGQDAINITYTNKATVDLSDGTVRLYYANPSKSKVDVVVSLVVQDKIICQSQRIAPGHQINTLPLLDEAKSFLIVGGYDAKYVVGCYDPETNQKDLVELEGGVHLEVVE